MAFELCSHYLILYYFLFLLASILEIQSIPINAPPIRPKATLGAKVKSAVTNAGIYASNAVIKAKNNVRATVHRESDKHFIQGEIHKYNANQATNSGNKAQAAKLNAKSTMSYSKSAAYSKAGQKAKIW